MDFMWKWFVFLLFIAGLPYVFIYISTSESIELSSREHRDTRDRKSILPNERSLDENITRKEKIDRNKNINKTASIRLQRSPSKTKDENYSQFLAKKLDHKVRNKNMTHKERQYSLNYTIESSLINSDVNKHRKEKNYTIFEKESKIMKYISKRYNVRNDDIRDGNRFQGKQKLEPFSKRMSQGNTTYENQTEACKVSFDKDSLNKVRQELYKSEKDSVHLFYVHLDISNIRDFSSNYEEVDKLSNWQYVLKDQIFLLQLPVDFDLVTFNLLRHTHEEQFINLTSLYNNINCTKDSEETIKYTKILLWKELFNNDTKYYLCNRHYQKESGREALYYITTIWIGYDLICSRALTEIDTSAVYAEKDHLPLVIPIVAFLLSLQFVWIFALLDVWISKLKDGNNSKNEANHKEKSSLSYKKGDRPYGIIWILIKLLYGKCKCCNSCRTQDETKTCSFCCQSPQRRLTCLLWIFILLPFGLLRTVYRYELNKGSYEEYPHVLRTSEPMFIWITDKEANSLYVLVVDIIYATLGPLIFIWVGAWYYNMYTNKTTFVKYCERKRTNDENNETKDTNEFTGLSDGFVTGCHMLCSSCSNDISINKVIHVIFCFCPIFPFFSFGCACLQSKNSNKDANDMETSSAIPEIEERSSKESNGQIGTENNPRCSSIKDGATSSVDETPQSSDEDNKSSEPEETSSKESNEEMETEKNPRCSSSGMSPGTIKDGAVSSVDETRQSSDEDIKSSEPEETSSKESNEEMETEKNPRCSSSGMSPGTIKDGAASSVDETRQSSDEDIKSSEPEETSSKESNEEMETEKNPRCSSSGMSPGTIKDGAVSSVDETPQGTGEDIKPSGAGKTDVKDTTGNPATSRNINETSPHEDSKWRIIITVVQICCSLLCFIATYFICLRPILSTFTFLLRFGSYFVFVLLPIRVSIFRYTFLFVSVMIYLVKYLHEIVNMNSDILNYMFDVKENENEPKKHKSGIHVTQFKNKMESNKKLKSTQKEEKDYKSDNDLPEVNHARSTEDSCHSKSSSGEDRETISEEMYTYIYKQSRFVHKKFYFFALKTFIVLAYLSITLETFISYKDSLTSTSFRDIVEVILVFIGPYAISLFFKGNSKDFLTDDNKRDIKKFYKQYKSRGKSGEGKSNQKMASTSKKEKDDKSDNDLSEVNGAQSTEDPSHFKKSSAIERDTPETDKEKNNKTMEFIDKKKDVKNNIPLTELKKDQPRTDSSNSEKKRSSARKRSSSIGNQCDERKCLIPKHVGIN